jgi:RNA polymerase sigma-70 factor (ECF subfamily)
MATAVRAFEGVMSEGIGPYSVDTPLTHEQQTLFISNNLRRVFLLIYRMVGNVADAQDLTQEAFIKALQRKEQLRDLEKAAHWLSRIASNTAIDFLRRNGKVSFCEIDAMPDSLSDRMLDQFSTGADQNPEQMVLRTERRAWLERGLDTLTDRERTALLLRDVEGMAAEDVAKQLNCSKATVRSHIANARVKFKRYMERRRP